MDRKVLVVRAGSAPPAVIRAHGDMADWFGAILAPLAEVTVVDGVAGPLPDVAPFGGVVVTGSVASVTDREPWMERLSAWLVRAGETRQVLGVCFGHQLLAQALGGRVERHPEGPEAGTCEITLTDAGRRDPLFLGLPTPLRVQQMHEDHVAALPPGAALLATSAHAPVQAFAVGERLRGVQFHPEFDLARTRAFAEEAGAWLDAGRAGLQAEVLRGLALTPDSERVLTGWVERCVERG